MQPRKVVRVEPVGTCYMAKKNFQEYTEYSPCRTSKWNSLVICIWLLHTSYILLLCINGNILIDAILPLVVGFFLFFSHSHAHFLDYFRWNKKWWRKIDAVNCMLWFQWNCTFKSLMNDAVNGTLAGLVGIKTLVVKIVSNRMKPMHGWSYMCAKCERALNWAIAHTKQKSVQIISKFTKSLTRQRDSCYLTSEKCKRQNKTNENGCLFLNSRQTNTYTNVDCEPAPFAVAKNWN